VKTFADKAIKARVAASSRRSKAIGSGRRCHATSARSPAHARIRACGERAVATLKTWKILTRLRCCPHRSTTIVQAILVLQLIEEGRYSG
jgi:hypothetical protein